MLSTAHFRRFPYWTGAALLAAVACGGGGGGSKPGAGDDTNTFAGAMPGAPHNPAGMGARGGTAGASSTATGGAETAAGGNGQAGASAQAGTTNQSNGGTSNPDPEPPDPHPSWLAGYYANPGHRLTNSGTGAVSLSLTAAGSYSYTACNTCKPSAGTWEVQDGKLVLSGGVLSGSYDLASYLTPNCRILSLDGHKMWKSAVVAGCPFDLEPLTAAECAIAGKYTKHTETNGSSSSYDYDYGITLDVDRFYIYTYSTSKFLCASDNCQFFSEDQEPTVGTWKNSSPQSTSGYTFSKAPSCMGVGGGGGGGGSGGSGGVIDPPECTSNQCASSSTLKQCVNGKFVDFGCQQACLDAGYDATTGCALGNAGDEVCLCKTCADPCGCNPYADGYACGANLTPNADASQLYLCSGSATAGSVVCPSGCHAGGLGEADYCNNSSSNPCMNNPYNGEACGANLAVPLSGTALSTLYTCVNGQTTGSVICAYGCYAAPAGQADHCN